MELVKGDVVVFNGQSGYAAQKGARAIFQYEDDKYIHVKWIEDELVGGQTDGGYFREDFEKEMTKEEMIKKMKSDANYGADVAGLQKGATKAKKGATKDKATIKKQKAQLRNSGRVRDAAALFEQFLE